MQMDMHIYPRKKYSEGRGWDREWEKENPVS